MCARSVISIAMLAVGGALFMFTDAALSANCEKNPTHPQCGGGEPPPPPPPQPTSCPGDFPAFAYKKQIVTGERRKEKVTSEIYLTNSTADCSIMIFSEEDSIGDIDYIQRADGEGRIVWGQGREEGKGKNARTISTFQLLTFNVAQNGSITPPLPLTDSRIYTLPDEPGGIGDKKLSSDGKRLYFVIIQRVEEPDGTFVELDTLNVVNISNCSTDCPFTEIFEFPHEGTGSIAVNAEENRIYFSSHDRVPDVYRLEFIEKDEAGNWSIPTNIVTSEDTGYTACFGSYIDADIWPVSDSPFSGEIVAMSRADCDLGGIHVFHVENCMVHTTPSAPSCFSLGSSTVVNMIARTALPVFTSIQIGSGLAGPPSLLLYTFTADGIFNYNLESGSEEGDPVLQPLTLQEIYFPDPAD